MKNGYDNFLEIPHGDIEIDGTGGLSAGGV
jgi:hypothetical protein